MKRLSIAMGIFATVFLMMLNVRVWGQVANAPGTPGTGTSAETGINDGRGTGPYGATPDTEPSTRFNIRRASPVASATPRAGSTVAPGLMNSPFPTASPY